MIDRRVLFLRRVLAIDAIISGAFAMTLLIAASPLAQRFGLPAPLLSNVGLILLPWVAWNAWLARQTDPPRTQIWAVIGINILWIIDSALLLLSGWVQPTVHGIAFIIAQAIAVGVVAELQFIGVRRATSVTA